jgi:hypothetical protein
MTTAQILVASSTLSFQTNEPPKGGPYEKGGLYEASLPPNHVHG